MTENVAYRIYVALKVAATLAIVVGLPTAVVLSTSGKSENVEDSKKFFLLTGGGMLCLVAASIVKAKYRN